MFKRILVLIILVMLASIYLNAEECDSVVVDASTFTVTGDDYVAGANPLVIARTFSKSRIKKVTISNSDTTVAQTVTLWDGWTVDTSSASVTKIWEIDIDASGTAEVQIITEDFGDRWQLIANYGLAVTKSSTSSDVTVSIQYR